MSLFGSSPDESSLNPAVKSPLFDDYDGPASASPWDMPTPKKAAKGELIKTLLPASDVPDSYIDIFDAVVSDDDSPVGKISPAGVAKVLSAGNLGADDQSRIMNLIAPNGQLNDLNRNEFNVLLALIGLAQEKEDITLDSVDERRRKLPEPKLPSLYASTSLPVSELAAKPPQRPVSPPPTAPMPVETPKQQIPRKPSLDYPEADPWGSPALHRNHTHENTPPRTNGLPNQNGNGPPEPTRTTSNITSTSVPASIPASVPTPTTEPAQEQSAQQNSGTEGWGSYDNASESAASFLNSGGPGFGPSAIGGDFRPAAETSGRSFGGGQIISGGPEENITVTLLPGKEGMFMFQHHNYQVSSPKRGSRVVRRYSDFVWLLDCLHKRYPFRQLPLLPPKRVAVNGNHLAADSSFIEKRRRGLARFANALVRHPVLSQEQLVVMFLTVPTELSVWRKQATISVQEEFVGKSLPPGLEDSLAPTLNELFETTRAGIRRSAEHYINLCTLLDRLAKRNEGLAADHLRISLQLQLLTDASQATYAIDTNGVPLLNEGLQATAKHLSNSQTLLEDEARAWDQGVLEDLKKQRDTLVSMRELFDRRDRYDKDNIPYLERRIQSNEAKLIAVRGKPEGTVKPGEIEKITEAIIKDKESIVAQHARGVFIKECIKDELQYFQRSQRSVCLWTQDWAQERVKYSELQADNWKQLQEELEGIPMAD
ncbi:sorting nexin-like protein mvp1 [Xylogone sp. PMI_703]|nr:sorting nexin-like protein mvp1 [Xylogone sp. PMI_703]